MAPRGLCQEGIRLLPLAPPPLLAAQPLDLGHLGSDRGHATLLDSHLLEVAEVKTERLVLGPEAVDVHGLAAGPHVLGMLHEGVEVRAAEPPGGAEGAPVHVAGEEVVVLTGLQPPQHMTSLGVLRLVVAAEVAAILLLEKIVECNKDMIEIL